MSSLTGRRGLKTAQKFVINQRANCKYHRGGSREPNINEPNISDRVFKIRLDPRIIPGAIRGKFLRRQKFFAIPPPPSSYIGSPSTRLISFVS